MWQYANPFKIHDDPQKRKKMYTLRLIKYTTLINESSINSIRDLRARNNVFECEQNNSNCKWNKIEVTNVKSTKRQGTYRSWYKKPKPHSSFRLHKSRTQPISENYFRNNFPELQTLTETKSTRVPSNLCRKYRSSDTKYWNSMLFRTQKSIKPRTTSKNEKCKHCNSSSRRLQSDCNKIC